MRDIWLDESFNLWTMVHQTRDTMMAAREKEIAKHGLSGIEQRLLLIIPSIEKVTDGKVISSEIARWLFKKPSSISQLLTRMEKRGLIQRLPCANNKKEIIIKVTEKGKYLCAKANNEGRFINKIISSLSDEERHQLWIIMRKLRNIALKELDIAKEPPFPQFL